MATAGTIAINLQANGVAKFSAAMGDVVKRLQAMKGATESAGGGLDKLREKMSDGSSGVGKYLKALAGISALKVAFGLADAAKATSVAGDAFKAAGGDLSDLRKATHGMISDAELIKKANLAETMGINGKAFQGLAQIALASAAKTGQSVEYLFESIVVGTARQSKLILDNLGIIINVDDANKRYAATLKRNVSTLTETEKKTAFMNAVMGQGDKIMRQLAQAGIDITNPFSQFTAQLKNSSDVLGNMLIPLFVELMALIQPAFALVTRMGDAWNKLNPTVKETAARIVALTIAGAGLLVALNYMPAILARISAAVAVAAVRLPMMFLGAIKGALAFITTMGPIILAVVGVIAAVALLRAGWEKWGADAKMVVADAFGWITQTAIPALGDGFKSLVVFLVSIFVHIGNGWQMLFSGMLQLVVYVMKEVIGIFMPGIDLILKGIGGMVGTLGDAASAMGLDTLGETFQEVGADIKKTASLTDDMQAALTRFGKANIAKSWDVDAVTADVVTMFGKMSDSAKGIASGLWDGVKQAGGGLMEYLNKGVNEAKKVGGALGEEIMKGLALLAKDFGISFDTKGPGRITPDKAAPDLPGGDKAGAKAAKELAEAQKDWAEAMRDMRDRMELDATAEKFRDMKSVSQDLNKQLRELVEKAEKAQVSQSEFGKATDMARKHAQAELAARVSAATSLDGFTQALEFARNEALSNGLDANAVAKGATFEPSDLSGVLSGRVGQMLDVVTKQLGLNVAGASRDDLVKTISDGIAKLLQDGTLDFDLIGKAIGRLLGSTKEGGDLLSKIFGGGADAVQKGAGGLADAAGSAAGGAGQLASVAGPALAGGGAAAGGAAGSVAPGIGNVIGMAVGAFVGVVLPMLLEGFKSIANFLMGVPEMISNALKSAATLIFKPTGRSKDAMDAALSPATIGMALLAGAAILLIPVIMGVASALTAAAPAIIAVVTGLTLFAPVLTLAVLGVAAFLVLVLSLVAHFVTFMAAVLAAIVVIVLFTSFLLTLITPMAPLGILFLMLGSVLLVAMIAVAAFTAVLMGALGLAAGFLKLATETKSFEKFKAAFEAVIGRIVDALEPFFQNLLPLIGLLDGVVSILIPLATSFANLSMVTRALFDVLKIGALALGVFIIAVAMMASLFLTVVQNVANGSADFVDSLGFMQNGINAVVDAMLSASKFMLQGILDAFGDVMTREMRESLRTMIGGISDSIGQGHDARDLSSSLRGIADTAEAAQPDISGMTTALGDLANMTYEEAAARAESLAVEQDASEQLSNVPSGYKVALRRFQNIQDELGNFDEQSANQGAGNTGSGGGMDSFQGVIAPISIGTLTIVTDDPDEMGRELARRAGRGEMARTGRTTPRRDYRYNGP